LFAVVDIYSVRFDGFIDVVQWSQEFWYFWAGVVRIVGKTIWNAHKRAYKHMFRKHLNRGTYTQVDRKQLEKA
jgi:hypothetical protein